MSASHVKDLSGYIQKVIHSSKSGLKNLLFGSVHNTNNIKTILYSRIVGERRGQYEKHNVSNQFLE